MLIQQQKFFMVKLCANKPLQRVDASTLVSASTAIVPYHPGKGCYSPQGSNLSWWECIPTGDELDEQKEENLADFQQQNGLEGQTWWPVVSLKFKEPDVMGDYLRWYSKHWACCVYQLTEFPLTVWPISPARWADED